MWCVCWYVRNIRALLLISSHEKLHRRGSHHIRILWDSHGGNHLNKWDAMFSFFFLRFYFKDLNIV